MQLTTQGQGADLQSTQNALIAAGLQADGTLVQGYVVEGPGFRYDASARAALKSLYEKLVT